MTLPDSLARRCLLRLAAFAFALAPAVRPGHAQTRPLSLDRIALPPDVRQFRSASGQHVLTVESPDRWKSKLATGRLVRMQGPASTVLWRQTLPHEHGPRRVLVLDGGQVVLMDEWINVPSRFALMLLAPGGAILGAYGFDDLVRLLDVSRRAVADQARLGLWLSAMPTPTEDGGAVMFQTAGKRLRLDVADGQLEVVD